MHMSLPLNKKRRCTRKGFSLVELVVVILIIAILAVAVFAGGSAVIKNAQISRTTSDLHNFSVAVESFLNSNPSVANISTTTDFATVDTSLVKSLNSALAESYQLRAVGSLPQGISNTGSAGVVAFESVKKDAWDNPYYVVFDLNERHGSANSDFYVYVISAGPNARTDITGAIEKDDIFLLAQYENGDVTATTYNLNDGKTKLQAYDSGTNSLKELTVGTAKYVSNTPAECPVNF